MTYFAPPRGVTWGPPPLDQPYPAAPYGDAWVRFWKKGFTFTGRASRAEYWKFTLLNILVGLALYLVLIVAILTGQATTPAGTGFGVIGSLAFVILMVYLLFGLATIVPSLALTVRRLHDANYSGWLYLISLIPFGSIVLLILLAQASNPLGARFDLGAHANQPWGTGPAGSVPLAYQPPQGYQQPGQYPPHYYVPQPQTPQYYTPQPPPRPSGFTGWEAPEPEPGDDEATLREQWPGYEPPEQPRTRD